MKSEQLKKMVIDSLEDVKAKDITVLDVGELTDIADYMVICTGSSNRHCKSLAENVVVEAKKQGVQPLGVEGRQASDWVLVDFGDVVVHVMLESARNFYDLERLWTLQDQPEE